MVHRKPHLAQERCPLSSCPAAYDADEEIIGSVAAASLPLITYMWRRIPDRKRSSGPRVCTAVGQQGSAGGVM